MAFWVYGADIILVLQKNEKNLTLTKDFHNGLTLNLLNLLNELIHFPFFELSIFIFRDIKMITWKLVSQQYRAWSQMCRLAWH